MLNISLAHFARSKLWKLVNFRTFCAKKLFQDFICFICRIREVHYSELVKGISHLSAARRQIGRKTAVFWSVKNSIWSGKSQWKVREFCFCMRVATLWTMWLYHRVVRPKDAHGMANSVDPDLIWICTVCQDQSVRKLRIVTVCEMVLQLQLPFVWSERQLSRNLWPQHGDKLGTVDYSQQILPQTLAVIQLHSKPINRT